MTARALRAPGLRQAGLRVVQGRRRRRPVITPFVSFTVIVLGALFGIVFARTALDQGAFDLAKLDRGIVEAQAQNAQLRLQVASLESPIRIAPLAEEMGMVFPTEEQVVLVAVPSEAPSSEDPRWASIDRYAAAAAGTETDR